MPWTGRTHGGPLRRRRRRAAAGAPRPVRAAGRVRRGGARDADAAPLRAGRDPGRAGRCDRARLPVGFGTRPGGLAARAGQGCRLGAGRRWRGRRRRLRRWRQRASTDPPDQPFTAPRPGSSPRRVARRLRWVSSAVIGAVVQDEDTVGGVQQRRAAGDHDGGAAPAQLRDVARDELFGDRVDGRRRVVQDQDVGVGGQGAGQGQPSGAARRRGSRRGRGRRSRGPRGAGRRRRSAWTPRRPRGPSDWCPTGRCSCGGCPRRSRRRTGSPACARGRASTDRSAISRPPTRTAPSYASGGTFDRQDRGEVGGRARLVGGDRHELAGAAPGT